MLTGLLVLKAGSSLNQIDPFDGIGGVDEVDWFASLVDFVHATGTHSGSELCGEASLAIVFCNAL